MNQGKNKLFRTLVIVLLLLSVGIVSCEKYKYNPPAVDPDTVWKLSTDIQPVFNSNCISCHGGSLSPDLREGKSFNALTKGGYVNVPAGESKLYSILNEASHLPRTTETERLKILYWITQGAQNN